MKTPKIFALALFLLVAGLAASARSLTFTSTTFVVGTEDSGPDCVATADVNGDGKLDLISANYGFRWGLPGDPGGWGTNLTVLTNNSSGGFGFNATLIVGRGPSSVVAADLNGDGKPDLINANETDNTLTVLTNDGSGGFGFNAALTVGSRPHGVVAVDVNGDRSLDLMCVNAGGNTVTVLINQGGGFVFSATLTVGSEPLALAAADVNGDGKQDLISANKNDDTLTVLTNDGSGGFAFSATLPVGHFPDWVSAADLNGDRKADLVSVNWGAATMTVLTNGGSGVFGFNATLGVGNSPSSVAAADFNGDGKADLICASTEANSLSVLTNNGSGVFGYNTTLPTGRIPNVWPGDLNGDGKLDLACPNFRDGTVTVLLNTTPFLPLQPPAGLVGWWPGDGHPLDLSGGGHTATLAGASYTTGKVGAGFGFDADGNSVSIDHNADFDVHPGGFTVEFWMQGVKNQPQSLYLVVDKSHGWADSTGWLFQGYSDSGRIFFGIGVGGGSINNFPLATSTTDVLDGQWHHIAGTWDGSFLRIFVDGAAQGQAALTTPFNNTRPVILGYSWGGGSPTRFFRGKVDELAIYNRALTSDEISGIHAAAGAGKSKPVPYLPSGLISWWRGEGDTADWMTNHPGTPVGALSYTNGQVGQAFLLNGQDAAVALGNWFTNQQFTLSLWVRPAATQATYANLLDNAHSDYGSWAIQYDNAADATRSYWHWGTSLPSGGGSVSFALTNNTWQHWVLTLGADRVQRLYLDGELAGSTTNTAAIPYDGSQYFNLGRHHLYGRYFNGMVDELMCFDRALEPAEVTSLYVNQGGRPKLNIETSSPGVVRLSWPLGATANRVEATTNLASGIWTTVTDAVVPDGLRNTIPLENTGTARFFRLKSGN